MTTTTAFDPCVRRLLCVLDHQPGKTERANRMLAIASPTEVSDLVALCERGMLVTLTPEGNPLDLALHTATTSALKMKNVVLTLTRAGSEWVQGNPANRIIRSAVAAGRSGRRLSDPLVMSLRDAVVEAADRGWVTLVDERGKEQRVLPGRGHEDIAGWSVKATRMGRDVVGL